MIQEDNLKHIFSHPDRLLQLHVETQGVKSLFYVGQVLEACRRSWTIAEPLVRIVRIADTGTLWATCTKEWRARIALKTL